MKLTRFPVLLLCLCLSASLAGCVGIFRDRGHDYRRAPVMPPLELPPGVESATLGDSYRVPRLESYDVLPGEFQVPRPESLVQDAEQGVVRIQRLGEERWILLNGTPGQVWPRLRGFLNVSSLGVARTDAVNGIIETAWLQPKGEGLARERYRFRIEQGVQRGTSEIFVLQSTAPEGWPKQSSLPEREQDMTMAVAQYFADTEAAVSVSMLAQQNVGAGGKVFVERDDKGHLIRLLLSFDRAWASLELALDKAGFKIEDRDRSQGRYWVTYAEESKKEGWFKRLFSDDAEQAPARFWVDMEQRAEGVMVIRVSNQDGSPLAPELAEQLLNRIKGYLS